MDKRKIIRIVLLVAVCCLLLYAILRYVPWRTRVDVEMVCTEVTQDGTVVQTGTFTLKGWELKYLLEKDDSYREIDVESFKLLEFSPDLRYETTMVLMTKHHPYLASGAFFDGYKSRHFTFSLEKDWKTCLIRLDGERYFACSPDGTVPVADILETHKWILD